MERHRRSRSRWPLFTDRGAIPDRPTPPLGEGFLADAAFVDGSHIFHNVFVDSFYLCELVHPGGLVILDDCSYPSVATAVRYFEANTGWQTEPMLAPTRLRAFRLPKERTEPSFESFKPFGLDTAP